MPEHTRSQSLPFVKKIENNPIGNDVKQLIASALAQVLTPLGVRFKCSVQPYQPDDQRKYPGTTPRASGFKPLEYRLRVLCYSRKSLDYQILAEPLAIKLRSLNLQGFHDAIVQFDRSGSQVGELRLRLNLTPSGIVFENWARWGDVQSIAKLLNLALADEEMQVNIALKNLSLHIFCTLDTPKTLKTSLRLSATFPSRKIALDIITPLLIKLSPQGIQGATIYGVKRVPDPSKSVEESPIWTYWLDLPGMSNPRFSPTALILAEHGNKHAIKFVLERFLNPDLDRYCATGGINLSLLRRNRVLNIMSEAPICPIQSQVAPTVVKILNQLKLPNISGVRVYGRIAGQSKPQWTYGIDFDSLPLELSPVASQPQSVAASSVTKLGGIEQLREYLLMTGIWKSQLQSVKVAPLSTIPKFRWEPSFLLLLGIGLVVAISSDWLLATGLEKTILTAKTDTTVVTSPLSFNNPLLDEKLAQYRSICTQEGVPDVLIVGSSRALRGVDPDVLRRTLDERGYPDLKIYNFGINGATARTVDLLLRQVLTVKQLPKLIIWADGARAFNSGRIDRTYENIISSNRYRQSILMSGGNNNNQSPLFQIQTAVKSSYEAIDTTISSGFGQVSPVYHHRGEIKTWLQSQLPNMGNLDRGSENHLDADTNKNWQYNPDGFLPLEVKFNPHTYYQSYTKVSGAGDGDYGNFQLAGSQHQALQEVIDLLTQRKVSLVFVNLPLTDIYLDKYRQNHETNFKEYMQVSANLNRLTFVDLDGSFNTRYDLFSDPSHLNQFGASEVSRQLANTSSIPWRK